MFSEQNPIYLIVWKVFCGNPPKGYDIHHKDHNKLNDRLDNLELMEHGKHTSHHSKGRKWTKEMYEKQIAVQTGKHCGELNPMFGKHHSQEAKDKLMENIRQFDERIKLDRERLEFDKSKAKEDARLKEKQINKKPTNNK